ALCTHARANDELRGITGIQYVTHLNPQMAGQRCAFDEARWKTSLHFVANQSVKLRLMSETEYTAEMKQVRARSSAQKTGKADKNVNDVADTADDSLFFIPMLHITAVGIEVGAGCAGTVNASLSAFTDTTTIIGTGTQLPLPSVEIWRRMTMVKGSPDYFATNMIRGAEDLMKTLVNEWTEAQRR